MIDLRLGDVKEPLPKRLLGKFCKGVFKEVNLYPQNYGLLVSKLAEIHGVSPEEIVLVNGVDEGIELISRVFGKDILIFPPSYYEFADAPKRNGLKFGQVNCFDGKGYSLAYKDGDVKGRSLIFLCNPNNPFGLLKRTDIVGLAKKADGIVAVDETYIDFGGESAINEFESVPNLLVLRSFSKSFSAAGLRIGYIVGKKHLIDKIKQRKLLCNVASVSVYAAMILLNEKKYFKELIQKVEKRKGAFEYFFKKQGYDVIHTSTNNIVLKFNTEKEAGEFCFFLKENGVLVNQGNGVSTCGLDETFVRFSCGTDKQMKALRGIVEKRFYAP